MDDVTKWIEGLKQGDGFAAQKIWECYYGKLVQLASRRLGNLPRRASDEEDIALSAFKSFCLGAEAGKFPQLADRHDLWNLLITITARKATTQRRWQLAKKRGAGKVRRDSVLQAGGNSDDLAAIEHVFGKEPTPETAAIVAETLRRMREQLPDDTLRRIADWKMEGYKNEEIASFLGCVPRTVERKLVRIREIWQHANPSTGQNEPA